MPKKRPFRIFQDENGYYVIRNRKRKYLKKLEEQQMTYTGPHDEIYKMKHPESKTIKEQKTKIPLRIKDGVLQVGTVDPSIQRWQRINESEKLFRKSREDELKIQKTRSEQEQKIAENKQKQEELKKESADLISILSEEIQKISKEIMETKWSFLGQKEKKEKELEKLNEKMLAVKEGTEAKIEELQKEIKFIGKVMDIKGIEEQTGIKPEEYKENTELLQSYFVSNFNKPGMLAFWDLLDKAVPISMHVEDFKSNEYTMILLYVSLLTSIPFARNILNKFIVNTATYGFEGALELAKRHVQKGGGVEEDGLYSDEIVRMMKPYIGKGFLGVISNDEIPEIIDLSLGYDKFGWIMNTDNHDQEGSHWVAVWVDITKGEIDYFDSFANDPSPEFMRDIKELVDAHGINYYMKLKINKIKKQADKSSLCGFHAMGFLLDMFAGREFINATGYNDSRKGEKKARGLEKKFGYV